MTQRFVLEGEQPEDEAGLGYIAAGLGLVALACLVAVLVKHHAPSREIAAAVVVVGAVASVGNYLSDLHSRVILMLGDDGFTMHGNRRATIFVSHSVITNVEALERGFVEVERTDGTTLAFRARPKLPHSRDHRARELVTAIEATRDAFREWEEQRLAAPFLDPAGRPASQFVADIRSLTKDQVVTYRSAPFDRDRLIRVAENPAARAQDRVSAFIALRMDASDDEMMRLRNSLGNVADDSMAARLRVAMHSDDDGELARALDLDEEEEGPLSLPQRIRRRRAI